MKPFQITSSNLAELADMPSSVTPLQGSSMRMSKWHAEIGSLEANSYLFPNMMVMSMDWNIKNDLLIVDTDDSSNVAMNFQLDGSLLSNFRNMRMLDIQPRTHNMVFSNPAQHTHHIPGGQALKMLHVVIDKQYFRQLIGTEDRWAENVLNNLEKERPFVGGHLNPTMTPAMQHLVRSVWDNPWQGSVRNLQVQARLFELLALQLDQFRMDDVCAPGLSKEDIEKLHKLHIFLQQHFLEDLSLFQLARLFTMNEFKLKKGFRALFNNTVFGYIRDLKMQHATKLLMDDRKTVEEVAYALGFEHAHHFSASFKKHFGVSPSLWNRSSASLRARS